HGPPPSYRRPAPAAAAAGSGRPELTRLARQGSLGLVGAAVSAVLGFAYVVVLGRGLGAGGAGLVLEAVAVFTILANATELGADTGLVRMLPLLIAGGRRRDVRSAIEVAIVPPLVASVIAAGALALFAPQLADVFIRHEHATEAVRMLRILAPFLPLATLATLSLAASRSFGSIVPYVAIQNVGIPLLRPLLTVASISLGLGIVSAALAWSMPLALAAVLSLAVLGRGLVRSRRRERASIVPRAPRRDVAREFWSFAAPRGLTGVLAVTLLWFDVLLVGAFLSTREAGVYASASRYVVAGTFALQALGLAIGPQISRLLAEQRREEAGDVFRMATCWLMALSWPLYLTMAIFSPVLMGLFGAEFRTGSTSLTILALALLVLMGTGNNKIVLLMAGKSSSNLAITGVTLVLNVVLDLWLIPVLGINGAAIGWGVATVVDNVLTTLVLHRAVGLDPFGRAYPIVAGGALLCFGGVGLLVRSVLGATYPAVVLYLALALPPFLALLWRQREVLHLRAFRSMLRPGAGAFS
ncbi:MAG: polysaccharide biosynthesis C-terminal domain-containing protein, partial [Acidimicrobiales bacterium]